VFGCPAFVHIDESSRRKLGDGREVIVGRHGRE
jgi:hypothetical protein